MKLSNLLNIILVIALLILTFLYARQKGTVDDAQAVSPTADTMPAQPSWQQKDIDSVALNPFTLFQQSAALTVGNADSANSMTIGWGEIGILWGHDCHVATVYVRKSRFTHHLMEQNATFTIEGFGTEYADQMKYLGTASGRDEDKMKGCGLKVKQLPSGNIAFEEGKIIIECRKLYSYDMNTQQMDSSVVSRWYTRGDDFDNIHTAYVGEITAVWVKE